jgi:hypothetical protein
MIIKSINILKNRFNVFGNDKIFLEANMLLRIILKFLKASDLFLETSELFLEIYLLLKKTLSFSKTLSRFLRS